MNEASKSSGRIFQLLLLILILMAAAMAVGYYLSVNRFQKKSDSLQDMISRFEGKYEMVLTGLQSDIMEIKAYIQDKEGRTEAETKKIRLTGILLKSKGEIISAKISLSQEDVPKAIELIDSAIQVLKTGLELSEDDFRDKIEETRLQLATVKGLIEVNTFKAQQELDKLWRSIEKLVEEI
jgi:hypothetical protein